MSSVRYKLTVEYDGTLFSGWQKQLGLRTVQTSIEQAVEKLTKVKIDVVASGRTDAGVHALGQVVHLDLPREYPEFEVASALNHFLPEDVAISNVAKVHHSFHARYDAKNRCYIYNIYNRRVASPMHRKTAWHYPYKQLNIDLLQQAANVLLGTHDLSSFRNVNCQADSPIRTIDNIQLSQTGEMISLLISAKSFLYNQVRIIVGTITDVASKYQGDEIEQVMQDILNKKDRKYAGQTAPPNGLFLKEIQY